MALYILRRLAGLLLSLAVLSVIVFSLMHVAPGGPFSYDQNMPAYMMANIAHKYGLDRPVYEQYFSWLSAMLQGDFGSRTRARPRRSSRSCSEHGPSR